MNKNVKHVEFHWVEGKPEVNPADEARLDQSAGPDLRQPHGGWIQTFTGRAVFPLDPREEDIDILDIAHALSLQCRFSGHVREFYSVAEHSVRVAKLVADLDGTFLPGASDALWALLHDASEAYLVDVPRPIKRAVGMEAYREAERGLQRVICRRFGLPEEEPVAVRLADQTLLSTEARDLMPPNEEYWGQWRADFPPLERRIEPWSSYSAKLSFLQWWERLKP